MMEKQTEPFQDSKYNISNTNASDYLYKKKICNQKKVIILWKIKNYMMDIVMIVLEYFKS